jgi:hypothetical protein
LGECGRDVGRDVSVYGSLEFEARGKKGRTAKLFDR